MFAELWLTFQYFILHEKRNYYTTLLRIRKRSFEVHNHWMNLFFDQLWSFWRTSSFELRMIYNIQLFSYILEILNPFHNCLWAIVMQNCIFIAKRFAATKMLIHAIMWYAIFKEMRCPWINLLVKSECNNKYIVQVLCYK